MCLASPFGGAFYCGGSVSFSAAFGALDEQKSSPTVGFHAGLDPSEMCPFSGLLTCRNIPTPTRACSAL